MLRPRALHAPALGLARAAPALLLWLLLLLLLFLLHCFLLLLLPPAPLLVARLAACTRVETMSKACQSNREATPLRCRNAVPHISNATGTTSSGSLHPPAPPAPPLPPAPAMSPRASWASSSEISPSTCSTSPRHSPSAASASACTPDKEGAADANRATQPRSCLCTAGHKCSFTSSINQSTAGHQRPALACARAAAASTSSRALSRSIHSSSSATCSAA